MTQTKFDISDYILILITLLMGLIVIIIVTSIFTDIITQTKQVDPEVINGLLTVSGVIFAFQATYFRKPKKKMHKILFTVIFVIEILLLGFTGLSYVQDISTIGSPTANSLFTAFTSLIYNIAITGIFVVFDLFAISLQEEKRPT